MVIVGPLFQRYVVASMLKSRRHKPTQHATCAPREQNLAGESSKSKCISSSSKQPMEEEEEDEKEGEKAGVGGGGRGGGSRSGKGGGGADERGHWRLSHHVSGMCLPLLHVC
jgi:hypothetical protein